MLFTCKKKKKLLGKTAEKVTAKWYPACFLSCYVYINYEHSPSRISFWHVYIRYRAELDPSPSSVLDAGVKLAWLLRISAQVITAAMTNSLAIKKISCICFFFLNSTFFCACCCMCLYSEQVFLTPANVLFGFLLDDSCRDFSSLLFLQ